MKFLIQSDRRMISKVYFTDSCTGGMVVESQNHTSENRTVGTVLYRQKLHEYAVHRLLYATQAISSTDFLRVMFVCLQINALGWSNTILIDGLRRANEIQYQLVTIRVISSQFF